MAQAHIGVADVQAQMGGQSRYPRSETHPAAHTSFIHRFPAQLGPIPSLRLTALTSRGMRHCRYALGWNRLAPAASRHRLSQTTTHPLMGWQTLLSQGLKWRRN